MLSLARQYFEHGWWKGALYEHLWLLCPRQLAPMALLTGLSASAVSLLLGPVTAGLALPSIYLATLVAGALVMCCRRRLATAAALVPLVLTVMHLSWDLGFVLSAGRRLLSTVIAFGG